MHAAGVGLGLAAIALALAGPAVAAARAAPARAHAGVLDLTGWSLARDGPVWLNGEWAFYWQRLLKPADFAGGVAPRPDAYQLAPGPWTQARPDGAAFSAKGYATYRLQIHLDPGQPGDSRSPLAIAIRYVCSAYRLWVDGKLVASNGRVGTFPGAEQPQYLPVLATFVPRGPTVDLVMQVSNFYHRCSGIWNPIIIGPAGALRRQQTRSLALAVFLLGAILIMALYHIGLYLLRRTERVALYFGLFCLVIALRATVTGDELWLRVMPETPTGIELRLEYLTDYLGLPLFMLLLNGLFPHEVARRVVWVSSGVAGAGVVSLALPAAAASWGILVFEGVLLVFVAYGLAGTVLAVRRRRDGALIFLVGAAVFFAALVNDLLNYNHLAFTGEMLPFGLFALILSQSVLLAQRFSHAFTELQRSRRLLTEREEALRRDVAEMLHGGVQTRLLVAAHRMAAAHDALVGGRPEDAQAQLALARKVLEEVREHDVRAVSHLLHPSIIRVGLVPAVRSLADRLADRFRVEVEVGERLSRLDQVVDNRIPQSTRLAAYRILEEALNNVAAHAGASRADVHMDITPGGQLELVVRDDGQGFAAGQFRPGLGLRSVAARVAELGGTWDIAARPGHGTALSVRIPLRGNHLDVPAAWATRALS